jgi:catechol 2,3-dioxygenase-like lactoylglutathione lyase family enzyme
MKVLNVVPVIAVKDIARSRVFYTETLDFEVVHQNEWYLHLRSGGDDKVEIGFVMSNHPSQPAIFQPAFDGRGVFYSLDVADVDAEYRKMKEAGVTIRLELRDEPWGERHFAIEDPNGIILNVSHTEAGRRGQVDMREHMMAKERGVR